MATSSAALAARARAVSANNVLIAFPQDARPSQPPPREQRPRQQPLPLGPPPPLTRPLASPTHRWQRLCPARGTDTSLAASVPSVAVLRVAVSSSLAHRRAGGEQRARACTAGA
jgi:hypothetical protein